MNSDRPERDVVAALIWRNGRFFICQRPANKKRGLLWEFVGGKVESGETKEAALIRECREELDVTVSVGGAFMTVTHEYPDILIHLTLFHACITEGEPKLLEHVSCAWITPEEIPNYDFCPADVDILSRITALLGGYRYLTPHGLPGVHVFRETCSPSDRILYLHAGFEEALRVWELLATPKPMLAVPEGVDWNAELSPWQAKKVFRGGEDFAGRGEDYLNRLTGSVIPSVEAELGISPVHRGMAGYSLAGLFALWSVYRTDAFDFAASLSGSLWFDGFIEFMRSHRPSDRLKLAVLSLGDREKITKNARMASVEDCTKEAAAILRSCGVRCEWEMNPGGHFQDVPERIARGCAWFGSLLE